MIRPGNSLLFSSAVMQVRAASDAVRGSGARQMPSLVRRNESRLAAAALVLCALALCLPAISVPASYHAFADQVAWGVLPHARDVLSNAAFVGAGLMLLWQSRRYGADGDAAQKQMQLAVRVAAWGLMAAGLCSAIYHLQPDARGLALDRVGMSVAFAGVLGILVADRLAHMRVLPVMAGGLLLGVASAVGDLLHDNMTPWMLYQAGISALILVLPWLTRSRAGQGASYRSSLLGIAWWQVLAFYAAAKLCEWGDQALWQWTGQLISGHSAKHLVAAAAVWPLWQALRRQSGLR